MRLRRRRAGLSLPFTLLVFASLWLIVAPLLLRFTGEHAAVINHLVTGLLLLTLALRRLRRAAAVLPQWTDWVPAALGLWLLVSPWVFLASAHASVPRDDLLIGGLVLAIGLWSVSSRERQQN